MMILVSVLAGVMGWLALSALFSGYETGFYSINRVRLRFQVQNQQPDALRVQSFLHRPSFFIATLLVGNNIAVYYTTASVQDFLATSFSMQGSVLIILTTLLATPFILVFAEMVPKIVFRARADQATQGLSRVMSICEWLFLPATACISLYVRVIEFIMGTNNAPKNDVLDKETFQGILQEGHLEGVISQSQNELLSTLFEFETLILKDCLVPLQDIRTVASDITREQFIHIAKNNSHNRFPVTDSDNKDILGYVNLFEILQSPGEWNLKHYLHSLIPLSDDMEIVDAIGALHGQGRSMALVRESDGEGNVLGIVTLKDLVGRLIKFKLM